MGGGGSVAFTECLTPTKWSTSTTKWQVWIHSYESPAVPGPKNTQSTLRAHPPSTPTHAHAHPTHTPSEKHSTTSMYWYEWEHRGEKIQSDRAGQQGVIEDMSLKSHMGMWHMRDQGRRAFLAEAAAWTEARPHGSTQCARELRFWNTNGVKGKRVTGPEMR